MKVVVFDFEDGMLSPAAMRGEVLADALRAHGFDPSAPGPAPSVMRQVYGRTFDELVSRALAHHERIRQDPTLLELISIDAHTRYAHWLRDGAELWAGGVSVLDGMLQQASHRVVLRADSRRRDVVPFLERTAWHDRLALIRCADDPPVVGSAYRSSYCRSWEAIAQRLARWKVSPASVDIVSGHEHGKMVAQRVVSGLPVEEMGY